MQVQWTLTNRIEHREDGGLGLEELENSLNDKDKLFNTYERDMRNLGDTMERPNLQIMGIDKGEFHTRVIENNVNTTIAEISPNIEKKILI